MMEKPSSTKSLIKIILLSVLIPALLLVIAWFSMSKVTRSKFWFDEGWYQTFTLTNGLEVIVVPNHKIAAVSQMVWYKVGSIEDPAGKSGIAHFLEHLMFKGTKEFPDGEFSRIIEQNGGHENAFTGHDFTAYYQVISKDKLPLVMKLEADRMHNLELKRDAVESELDVILEERRMRIDNQPRALLKEQMDAGLYRNHPYGIQVIGWEKEMEGLTREDALEFYRKYYAPNNAILVVTGDVTAKEVEELAKKYYGAVLPNRNLQERKYIEPPEQGAPREVKVSDGRVKEAELWRSYIAPNYALSEEGDDFYAMILLSKIMGEGTLSRLYQSLVVEKKIAGMAGSSYSGLNYGPGEFSLYALPAAGVELPELRAALDEEVGKITGEMVSDEELQLAKKSLIAEQTYAHEGLEEIGYMVGSLAAIGIEPEFVTTFPDRINAITAEQVQAAAQKVFKPENSVTGVLRGK